MHHLLRLRLANLDLIWWRGLSSLNLTKVGQPIHHNGDVLVLGLYWFLSKILKLRQLLLLMQLVKVLLLLHLGYDLLLPVLGLLIHIFVALSFSSRHSFQWVHLMWVDSTVLLCFCKHRGLRILLFMDILWRWLAALLSHNALHLVIRAVRDEAVRDAVKDALDWPEWNRLLFFYGFDLFLKLYYFRDFGHNFILFVIDALVNKM
jgi:hypothetical protein